MSRNVPCAPSNRMLSPAPHGLVQQDYRVGDERLEVISRSAVFGMDFLERERLGAERLQDLVVLLDLCRELFLEALGIDQIDHAQARPRGLVAVGRADAALGGADLVLAFEQFALRIQFAVVGKDQVRRLAQEQVAVDLDPELAQPSISSTRPTGSTTTPLPMTQDLFLRRMPEGMRCRTYFWPSM